jgi:hypothetical protein
MRRAAKPPTKIAVSIPATAAIAPKASPPIGVEPAKTVV